MTAGDVLTLTGNTSPAAQAFLPPAAAPLADVLAEGNSTGGNTLVDNESDPVTLHTGSGVDTSIDMTLQAGGSFQIATSDATNILNENLFIGGGSGFAASSTVSAASAAPANASLAATNDQGTASIAAVGANDAMTAPQIVLTGLPTSDPGIPGALYQVAGVVKVSL